MNSWKCRRTVHTFLNLLRKQWWQCKHKMKINLIYHAPPLFISPALVFLYSLKERISIIQHLIYWKPKTVFCYERGTFIFSQILLPHIKLCGMFHIEMVFCKFYWLFMEIRKHFSKTNFFFLFYVIEMQNRRFIEWLWPTLTRAI